MCLATLPQTSTNMSDASMPNASQRVPHDADVDDQIQRIIADLPKINAKLENAPPATLFVGLSTTCLTSTRPRRLE